jgi:HD-like signal output (HDOD) protein
MGMLELKVPVNSVEKTIKEISGLVSLPEIYLKFRRLMENPNSTINEYCEVVSCDSNLTATILKLVNSAFFGFPGQIDSIHRAIIMLGIGQLHDMVLATSAMASMDLPNEIMPLRTFWRSSLFTGVLTRLLANQLKIPRADSLFVIGLLHEIGHLVIYSKYPEQAKIALESYYEGSHTLHAAEQELLGLHYGQVGAQLMAQWQLPPHFQALTQFQPTPSKAPDFQIETTLLHLAHGYAHQLYLEPDQPLEKLIFPAIWEALNLIPDDIKNCLDKAQQACADLEKMILK